MKYKSIEKGKVYKMKSLYDILKIEGVSLGKEASPYKGEYMSIRVMGGRYVWKRSSCLKRSTH